MATLDISHFCLDLFPQPTWASILAATFPLKCRTEEMGSLMFAGSKNPFSSLLPLPLFSSHCLFFVPLASSLLPLLRPPSRRRLSISPSVRSCSLKLYFASFSVTVLKCVLNVTKPNFQYTKGEIEV